MPTGKGKAVAGKGSSGKRKQEDEDKTGRRKRTNPGVLQFFEDIADVDDFDVSENDSDFFDDDDVGADFLDELMNQEVPDVNIEPGKAHIFPVIPKEEELSDGELENMVQERYRDGSGFVTFAEYGYDTKGSSERNFFMPSSKDPVIWKVKCMVGRERHSAFCLMQKYVHLRSSLGTKLQIISAFAPEHSKGFIYIEADRQCDVTEACKGLSFIYNSRVAPVPRNEISHLFSVRNKNIEISEGMWARVKSGKYKGDLAQVVFVDEARKKATVKLIPRIDFQALAEKYGSGATVKRTSIPASRLISSSELEEFRPLIQYRRDRDTGEVFEVLDNLLLKDGFLYKKVSIDSLSFWGVQPSEAELQKFVPPKKDESDASEFLTQLYGEKIKKLPTLSDKRGGKGKMEKGESSCGPCSENDFELHDFVLVGRKDFGVIIGMEKDDSYKILKEGKDGPTIVTIEQHDLKNGPRDRRFIGLDKHKKIISVNDSVRIVEGPYEGKEGIVKQVYRGIVFLHDENELENSGYVCTKSQRCEKIKLSADGCKDKGESGPSDFGDSSSAPKSPLSPDKPWEATNNTREFNQGDKDSMFSVGQMLRIRVGPLKGYLCRVVAIRRSEITVKLDSKQKVLTVKSEHLSEVRGKSFTNYSSEDPGSSSMKPFDLLGTEGGSDHWIGGIGISNGNSGWNAGGSSTERGSWPAFATLGTSLQPESGSANPLGSSDEPTKDTGAWESKVIPTQNSSWGTAAGDVNAGTSTDQGGSWDKSYETGAWESKVIPAQNFAWGAATGDVNDVATTNQDGTWGKGQGSWNKGSAQTNLDNGASDSWAKAETFGGNEAGTSKDAGNGWGSASGTGGKLDSVDDAASWGKQRSATDNQKADNAWSKRTNTGIEGDSREIATEKWNSKNDAGKSKSEWNSSTATPEIRVGSGGNADLSSTQPENINQAVGWEKPKSETGGPSANWGTVKHNDENAAGWNKPGYDKCDQADSDAWTKSKAAVAGEGSSWTKQGGQSSWNGQSGGSSWNKQGEANVGDASRGSWRQSESSNKPMTIGGGNGESCNDGDGWNKPKTLGDGEGSWNKQADGSTWKQQSGGSSWSRQGNTDAEDGWSSGKDQSESWEKPKSFGRADGGFGGWSKKNEDESNQRDSWDRSKSFEGGRGSGGRRGRGRGGSRGGRDNFGRGRSFGRGQDREEDVGVSDKKSPGWNSGGNWDASRSAEENASAGWNKKPASNEGLGDGNNWNRGTISAANTSRKCGIGEAGDRGSDWNNKSGGWGSERSSQDEGSEPNKGEPAGGWGASGHWNKRKAPDEPQNAEGKTREAPEGSNWNNRSGGWGTKHSSQEKGSGPNNEWNHGNPVDAEEAGHDLGSRTSENNSSRWNKQESEKEKSEGTGWGGGNTGWSSGKPGNAAGDESSGQPVKSSWGARALSEDGSGWNKKSENENGGEGDQGGWNSKKPSIGGSQSGCTQNNTWKNGTSDSGWGNKGNWNMKAASGDSASTVNDDESDTWKKGGNWGNDRSFGESRSSGWGRGKFANKDAPESSDFSGGSRGFGRGSSGPDRGFRGRGRGGFGGRGHGRRDQNGGWNRNDSGGEYKPWQNRNDSGGESKPWQNRNDSGEENKPWQNQSGRWNRNDFGEESKPWHNRNVFGKDKKPWDNKNESGEDKPWNQDPNYRGGNGWKSKDGGGSWGQGGNQNQGWKSGTGGSSDEGVNGRGQSSGGWKGNDGGGETKNQEGSGWSSQGPGWNNSGAKTGGGSWKGSDGVKVGGETSIEGGSGWGGRSSGGWKGNDGGGKTKNHEGGDWSSQGSGWNNSGAKDGRGSWKGSDGAKGGGESCNEGGSGEGGRSSGGWNDSDGGGKTKNHEGGDLSSQGSGWNNLGARGGSRSWKGSDGAKGGGETSNEGGTGWGGGSFGGWKGNDGGSKTKNQEGGDWSSQGSGWNNSGARGGGGSWKGSDGAKGGGETGNEGGSGWGGGSSGGWKGNDGGSKSKNQEGVDWSSQGSGRNNSGARGGGGSWKGSDGAKGGGETGNEGGSGWGGGSSGGWKGNDGGGKTKNKEGGDWSSQGSGWNNSGAKAGSGSWKGSDGAKGGDETSNEGGSGWGGGSSGGWKGNDGGDQTSNRQGGSGWGGQGSGWS